MTIFQRALLWILTSLPPFALAVLVNVTVDDDAPDPISGSKILYTQNWNYGPNCSFCATRPDIQQVLMRTWHDATYVYNISNPVPPLSTGTPQNATFEFTGKHYAYLVRKMLLTLTAIQDPRSMCMASCPTLL